MKTRPVTVTATRCYTGQIILHVPDFCRDERLCGIIRAGGATARLLARSMSFDRLQGTGLALPFVNSRDASKGPGSVPQLSLPEIAAALRADGLSF